MPDIANFTGDPEPDSNQTPAVVPDIANLADAPAQQQQPADAQPDQSNK